MFSSYASVAKGLSKVSSLKEKLEKLSERIRALNPEIAGKKITLNTEQLAKAKGIYDELALLEVKHNTSKELLEIRLRQMQLVFNPNLSQRNISKYNLFDEILSLAEKVYGNNQEKWAGFYLQVLDSAYLHCRTRIIKPCYLHAKENNRITPEIISLTSDYLHASLNRVKVAITETTAIRASRILKKVLDFLYTADDAELLAVYNQKISELFPTQYLHLTKVKGQPIHFKDMISALEASNIQTPLAASSASDPFRQLIPTDSFAIDAPSSPILLANIITRAKQFMGATLFAEAAYLSAERTAATTRTLLLPTN